LEFSVASRSIALDLAVASAAIVLVSDGADMVKPFTIEGASSK
jgi:hypothetical protein